jgi:ribosomal protein S18 acetylase RimI-like enzyme
VTADRAPPRLRDAGPADAARIAALHAASWQVAYRGILPDAYLDHECAAERQRYWHARLVAPQPGGFVMLAEQADALLAFLAVWPDPDGRYDALLDNLHVAPEARGRGLGRTLLGAAAARLQAQRRRSLTLWVFDANIAALDFYRRLGAEVVERGLDEFAGERIPHTRLAWEDVARLAAACRPGASAVRS